MSKTNKEINQEAIDNSKTEAKKKKESVIQSTVDKIKSATKKETTQKAGKKNIANEEKQKKSTSTEKKTKEIKVEEQKGQEKKDPEEKVNVEKKPAAEKKPATKEKAKPASEEQKKKAEAKKPEAKKEKTAPKKDKKTTDKGKATASKDKAPAKKDNDKWSIKQLGGLLFAKMLRGGASELHANAEEVNKLNVFPVPDGDTGDNMSMTIESGVASLDNIDTDDLAEVLKVASKGMLLGARGNSGVILSQFFAGMAKGLENVGAADAKKLAHALELGVQQAYTSVMTPTEGTILTVAREAVEYAVKRVNSKSTVQSLFSDLVKEMNASLARTPEILPALGEAGVVDSGGAGLLYIIDGLNRVLNGEEIEETELSSLSNAKTAVTADTSAFGPDSEMSFGYCTELLVQLMNRKIAEKPFDLDALKIYLATIGDSIVAFQTDSIVKVHVHTLRPEKVIAFLHRYGEFITVKIENMSLQHTELKNEEENAKTEAPAPKKKYGIVAVSNGSGVSDLFRELGTDQIVTGGQTNNPSTNDFLDAFDKINAENIFVFPNNGNIVMAASQAAEIYEKAKVYVVPAKSIGAGYVAMSTMNFDSSEPLALMEEAEDAIGRISSARVSPAVRDADINGVHVTEGDTMGIIDKDIVISGPDKMVSTYGLIDIMLADGGKFMLTIFFGKDATIEEREELESYIQKTYPNIEAYYVDGGQEIYPFLLVSE